MILQGALVKVASVQKSMTKGHIQPSNAAWLQSQLPSIGDEKRNSLPQAALKIKRKKKQQLQVIPLLMRLAWNA